MSITTVKVLRTISKIVLLIVGIGIVGYGGLMVYKSVANKPQRVRITNVTDSAATITWVTDNPVRGVVYYKDEGSFLPGPLSVLGSKVAYDDRDFALAQDECVKAFNENAKNTKDEDFAVDGNNFDCENIPVEKLGAYYTHSVTVKDLNSSSTYFFVVGNGIWSWSVDGVDKDVSENDLAVTNSFNFKTSQLLEKIPTPNIAYGTVYAAEYVDGGEALVESKSKDSIVLSYLITGEDKSQILSTVTNLEGGWIFDKSNFRDTEGNLITDLTDAIIVVCPQYENEEKGRCVEDGNFLTDDTQLDIKGNQVDDKFNPEKEGIKIIDKLRELINIVYGADSNTGAYDLSRCSDSGVDNCTDLNCIKKCPVWNTDNYSWVETGGKCAKPASCGSEDTKICTPNTCENYNGPSGIKSRKCNGTGYGYIGYYTENGCTNEKPTDPPDNEVICTPKECEPLDGTGGYHSQKCSTLGTGYIKYKGENCTNKEPVDPPENEKICTPGECKPLDGTGGYYSKKCSTLGTGYINYTGENCTNSGSTISCTDDDGKKYKLGAKCPQAGGTCLPTGLCSGTGSYVSCTAPSTCTYNSTTHRYEICKSGIIQSCSAPQQTCTVKAKYAAGLYDAEKECLNYGLTGCDITCRVDGGTAETNSSTKARCMTLYPSLKERVCEDTDYQGNDTEIDVNEINLEGLSDTKLKEFLKQSQELRTLVNGKVDSLLNSLSGYAGGDKCNWGGYIDAKNRASKYCGALDGNWKVGSKIKTCSNSHGPVCFSCDNDAMYNFTCDGRITFKLQPLVSKVYAETSSSNGYSLYLPEYGMYSFELGDYKIKTETTNGNTYYIFYVEANDKAGFQMPEDPENPTDKEDIMLKSDSAQIQHKKVSSAQTYTLEKGINIISFNFVPVSTELGTLTAGQVIEQAAKKDVDIQYISSFEGGRWAKGYTCKNDKCSGNDFNIIPGKGYLVYVTNGGDISIGGYDLKSAIPVNLSGGWNLVGIHGYTNAYTAASLIESINKVKGLTSDNVTWWPTSKAMYEGLQVTGTQQYGFDFPISPTNGYFVRISSFKPEDNKCKSLLWNEGGTLNGACGVTK